mmetsp:Transcript_6004/g.12193  ORF Transcript_6004/g.12193 Transcript_6004/m.12193 type:complete len:500 (-) Transcript_6004:75-1574(-)
MAPRVLWTLCAATVVSAIAVGTAPGAESPATTSKAVEEDFSLAASKALHSISDQLAKFQRTLIGRSAQFEKTLREQEQGNKALEIANEHISTEVETLEAGNRALEQRGKQFMHENSQLRAELRALEQKLGMAKAFAATAVDGSDRGDAAAFENAQLAPSERHGLRTRPAGDSPLRAAQLVNGGGDARKPEEAKENDEVGGTVTADQRTEGSAEDDGWAEAFEGGGGEGPLGEGDREEVGAGQAALLDGAAVGGLGDDVALSLLSVSARTASMQGRRREELEAVEPASVDLRGTETTDNEHESDAENEGETVAAQEVSLAQSVGAATIPTPHAQSSLSITMQDIARQEGHSTAQLETTFKVAFGTGQRRRLSLVARQRRLNATRLSLQRHRQRLAFATEHLGAVRGRLEARVRSLGDFLRRLASIATAPLGRAEALLGELPSSITVPPAGPALPEPSPSTQQALQPVASNGPILLQLRHRGPGSGGDDAGFWTGGTVGDA